MSKSLVLSAVRGRNLKGHQAVTLNLMLSAANTYKHIKNLLPDASPGIMFERMWVILAQI